MMRSRQHSASLRRSLAAFLVAAACAPAVAAAVPPARVAVTVDASKPGRGVAGDFLGLSFESRALPDIAAMASRGNLPVLLRSLGHGSMRFGGITSDTQVAWSDDGVTRPNWARATISPADLAGIGKLAGEARWQVLLTANLAHYDPQAAARESAAAVATIGSHLTAIEIGNEADSYGRHGERPLPWTFDNYAREVDDYMGAIRNVEPGVALAGPDATSAPNLGWLRREARDIVPALLTEHYYSLNCHDVPPPSIARLLSPDLRRRLEGRMRMVARVARANLIPLRLGETNNVSCGGWAGVSDTFASALWAVDFLTRAMTDGIDGVNLHGSIANCHGYGPLCAPTPGDLQRGNLHANPEWYALLLVRQLLGDRPVRARVARGHANLSATAFAGRRRRLDVVLVNSGPQPLVVALRLPARSASARLLRLRARSVDALAGVTLGGRMVGASGAWGPGPLPRVTTRTRVLPVVVPATSAVLATITPR